MPGGSLPRIVATVSGSCPTNPGAGGFAALLAWEGRVVEVAGGFALTTSNRVELAAVLAALGRLRRPAHVVVRSRSRSVVDGLRDGWADRWRTAGWVREGRPVPNADLWGSVLDAVARHQVEFRWVRHGVESAGHGASHRLAKEWAQRPGLPLDEGFASPCGGGAPLPGF